MPEMSKEYFDNEMPDFGDNSSKIVLNDYEKRFAAEPDAAKVRYSASTGRVKAFKDAAALPELFAKRDLEFTEGDEERVVEVIASDGRVDFDGDILHPKGWKTAQFQKNPQFFWMHNALNDPIGNVIKEELVERTNLKADTPDHLRYELRAVPYFARTRFGDDKLVLYKTGILRAVSVGFRPLKLKQLTEKQREELGLSRYGIFSTKQRLRELSAVTLPANGGALVTAKTRVDTEKYHQLFIKCDDMLQKVALQLEQLKTVTEINQRFDQLESMVKELLERPIESLSRTEELYGGSDLSFTQLESALEDLASELQDL